MLKRRPVLIIFFISNVLLGQKSTLVLQTARISPQITIIVFDLHNVIVTKDYAEMGHYLIKAPITFRSLLTLCNPLFIFYLCTLLRESGCAEEIATKLGMRFIQFKRYIPTTIAITNAQKPIIGVVQMIKRLKHLGYTLYVFSNVGKNTYHEMQQKYPDLFSCFDGYVVCESKDNWIQKPETQAFEKLINQLQIDAENILFIDDKYKNITLAQQLGISTIHFQHEQQFLDDMNTLLDPQY